ncbi:MAG: hypothetical protein WDN50_13970 [Bradyrhizobium sp.]
MVYKSTQDININPDDPNRSNNDNYKARPITVLLTPPPDLVVTAVAPQATGIGGDSFTVSWTVQNQGSNPTEINQLFDQVYLSDTPNFVPPDSGDVGNQWFLGTVEHDGIVNPSGSYTNQATFNLAPEISGKYVIVVANTGTDLVAPTWGGPIHQQQHRRWHHPRDSASGCRSARHVRDRACHQLFRRNDDGELDGCRISAPTPGRVPAIGTTTSTCRAIRPSTSAPRLLSGNTFTATIRR